MLARASAMRQKAAVQGQGVVHRTSGDDAYRALSGLACTTCKRLLGRTVGGESVRGYTLPLDKLKAESPELVCAACTGGSASSGRRYALHPAFLTPPASAGLTVALLSGSGPAATAAPDQRGAATLGRNARWSMSWASSGSCPTVVSPAAGGAAPYEYGVGQRQCGGQTMCTSAVGEQTCHERSRT